MSTAGLFLFSCLVALLLCELLFRLFVPQTVKEKLPQTVLVHQSSENLKLLYRPSPGVSKMAYGVVNQINSAGFRDQEIKIEKPEGTTRMIFLGDSVVYGYGLKQEKTIPKMLGAAYRKQGRPVEVLNFGVSGYDTEQAVEFLKETGLAFHPDIVLLGYTLNDSIYASMELDFFHDKVDRQIRTYRPEWRKQFWRFAFRHSRLLEHLNEKLQLEVRYKFFRTYREQSIWHYLEERNIADKDSPNSPYQLLKSEIVQDAERLGTPPEALKKILGFVGIDNDDFWSSHWGRSYGAAQGLAQLAAKHHFKVVVVIFPYGLTGDQYPLESLHRFLREEFEKLDFQVIDLLPWLKDQYPTYGWKLFNDPIHFSELGSEKVGVYLSGKLSPEA